RHVTAKQRRDQRKQKQQQSGSLAGDVSSPAQATGKLSKQEQRRLEEERKFELTQQKQQQQQQKRGRKGKMRKMKEKYADQDEEDRALRMALLGAGGKRDIDEALDQSMPILSGSIDTSDKEPTPAPLPLQPSSIENETDIVANVARMELSELPAVGNDADADEDVEDAQDVSVDQHLDALDKLTGAPLPGDNLSSAIPVCAPYSALASYKYRVKLVPGTMKKGKACKMAQTVTLAAADGNRPRSTYSADPAEAERLELELILANREKELMRVVPEPEMIAQMLGKVKVTAPNMESLRQKSKAAAKSKAKAKSASAAD
ncbi:hypothetical protein GGI05_007766, partial [Coemansia sp. RSA 2603]